MENTMNKEILRLFNSFLNLWNKNIKSLQIAMPINSDTAIVSNLMGPLKGHPGLFENINQKKKFKLLNNSVFKGLVQARKLKQSNLIRFVATNF